MVRIQLHKGGYLEVKEGTSFPLTLSVGDIREPDKKTGTFSKTITLVRSKNNDKLLNQYYDVNIVAGSFDINKLTYCDVLENGIPILENALLQLVAVSPSEYSVLIKTSAPDFFSKINDLELTDIDFSDFNHVYNTTNVQASWAGNNKYVYPLCQNPTNTYYLKEFKPAIYAKQYFDRIHARAGYSYQWDEQTAMKFDKAIIPYNGDVTQFNYEPFRVEANTTQVTPIAQVSGQITQGDTGIASWTETLDAQNLFNPTIGEYNNFFYESAGEAVNFNFRGIFRYELNNTSGGTAYLVPSATSTEIVNTDLQLSVYKNGVFLSNRIVASYQFVTSPSPFTPLNFPTGVTVLSGTVNQTFNLAISPLAPNDKLTFRVRLVVNGQNLPRWRSGTTTSDPLVSVGLRANLSGVSFSAIPSANTNPAGSTVNVNEYIPNKIKQKDFIKSILTMYNLFVEQDKQNPAKLIYKSRDKYYDDGVVLDWTKKKATDREELIEFIPELSSKSLLLTYKEDTDQPNVIYKDATNEVYGQARFVFDNEYARGEDKKELIFSPTPMSSTSFGAVVPIIAGSSPKTNIRILLHHGTTTCQAYNMYDYGTTGQTNVTTYPLISHFDDHYRPNFSLNFAPCDYYFYSGIQLTNNGLFNLYWRRTAGQINNGKLMTAYFHLTEADIQSLKLNAKIRLFNALWNINKVIDYDANNNTLTKVELISVDDSIALPPFIKNITIGSNPTGGTVGTSEQHNAEAQERVIENNNVNNSPSTYRLSGQNNVVQEGLEGSADGDGYQITYSRSIIKNLLVVGETQIADPTLDPSGTYTFGSVTISDSLTLGYKKYYTAHLTQVGTANPTVVENENQVTSVNWVRNDVGEYTGELPTVFDVNKMVLTIGNRELDYIVTAEMINTTTIKIRTFVRGFVINYPSDDVLNKTPIEIISYT